MWVYNFFGCSTNLLIVLGPRSTVKTDPKASLLLQFSNLLMKIRLSHLVQANLSLNSIYIIGQIGLFSHALIFLKTFNMSLSVEVKCLL